MASPPTIATRLVAIIPSQCILAEGPVWDDRLGRLWFTDIQSAQLLAWDHAAGTLQRWPLPERLGSLALTDDPGILLCALASGFALLDVQRLDIQWLHRLEPGYPGHRLNDGRIDRQGRFWAGTMVEDAARAPPDGGSLWRLDPPGSAPPVKLRSGIGISNAISFGLDGDSLFFADSPTGRIMRHTLPAAGQRLDAGQIFATLPAGHFPDGADVDAKGALWNAEWGGARVTAWAADGRALGQVPVPVSQPSCVAFGGPGLDLLFVTTARDGLDAAALAAQPHAGDVLVYAARQPGQFRGLPAGRFALKPA
ncbi:MAG: SMP-30/gluconolactonase/LRE family protein [Alphaproteobacteria bacterium]|nr:SMP-30/gluconolactonase/LRE family protein [Alphaproteobacteria bacterium]